MNPEKPTNVTHETDKLYLIRLFYMHKVSDDGHWLHM